MIGVLKMSETAAAAIPSTIGLNKRVASNISYQQMPLSVLHFGEKARILKIRDKGELHRHLETMGFVEGADVEVLNEANGDLIVEVKGVQVAIGRSVASRIITRAAS